MRDSKLSLRSAQEQARNSNNAVEDMKFKIRELQAQSEGWKAELKNMREEVKWHVATRFKLENALSQASIDIKPLNQINHEHRLVSTRPIDESKQDPEPTKVDSLKTQSSFEMKTHTLKEEKHELSLRQSSSSKEDTPIAAKSDENQEECREQTRNDSISAPATNSKSDQSTIIKLDSEQACEDLIPSDDLQGNDLADMHVSENSGSILQCAQQSNATMDTRSTFSDSDVPLPVRSRHKPSMQEHVKKLNRSFQNLREMHGIPRIG